MINKNLTIFLADDDEDDRDIFAMAIMECGINCNLITFVNGRELLDYFKASDCVMPDLIFLDLNMPICDGLSTLKTLRTMEECSQLKVAIYSTSSQPVDIQNTYEAGASLYVEKPRNFKALCLVINHLLNSGEKISTLPATRNSFLYAHSS